jgi:MFS family permease
METFLTLAAVYFVFMMAGALGYRVPAAGWKPAGWIAPVKAKANKMITEHHVHVSRVWGIPQFWLLWAVLCLNVTAGIGILGMSSPLLQEVFAGKLLGVDIAFNDLSLAQKGQIAAIAAGFTGMLSLFNIGGRFVWASCSDYIGRKTTYTVFFALALVLYASIPTFGHSGQLALFVAAFCVIVSMYGGGFATIPAYISDLFGTQMVGAIHGRILTAWATAGVLGPVLVAYIREYQIANGVPKAQAYDVTMYVLAGFILLGLLCNALVRPIADKHFMTAQQLAAQRQLAREREAAAGSGNVSPVRPGFRPDVSSPVLLMAAWLAVGIPLAVGIWITLQKAVVLFK